MVVSEAKRRVRLGLSSMVGDDRLMDVLSCKTGIDNETTAGCIRQAARVFVVGCPDYGNLGDHAIAFAQRKFIESVVGEAPIVFYGPLARYWSTLNSTLCEGDVICLQGGGNMGTLYESYENERLAIIDRFRNNRIILFPQTISYGVSPYEQKYVNHMRRVYGSHPDLHLVARERMSLARMKHLFPKADVVLTPDIVLSLNMFNNISGNVRKGLCFCLRADKERRVEKDTVGIITNAVGDQFDCIFQTDTMHSCDVLSPEEGEQAVCSKISELAKFNVVVTDRIHGMIFCALSGTPCIALDNSNGKVGQEYEWLKGLPYVRFARNVNEAVSIIREASLDSGEFPVKDFVPLFDPIAALLHEKCHGEV